MDRDRERQEMDRRGTRTGAGPETGIKQRHGTFECEKPKLIEIKLDGVSDPSKQI
jgi:hypothetical protein